MWRSGMLSRGLRANTLAPLPSPPSSSADAKMSGGWWVFTPSQERINTVLDLISKPVPTEGGGWGFGDMQVRGMQAPLLSPQSFGLTSLPPSLSPPGCAAHDGQGD